MKPIARTDNIFVQEVDDEIVLYDREHNRAHSLNTTAAVVWQHCDGERDLAALAAILREKVSEAADEDLVQLALDQLVAADLVDGVPPRSPAQMRFDRRGFMRKVGLVGAAGLALPLVTGILVPTPAAAATCDACTGCELCFCPPCACPCESCEPCICCSCEICCSCDFCDTCITGAA